MPPSKAAITRSAILDAGSVFLETRPFRDLTVGGLMATTEYSRPTFYLYFNDLHGFMETLLDEVKVGIVEGARAWLSNEGDAVGGLRQSLTTLVDVAHQHGPILKAVADAAPGDARLERVWEMFLGSFDEVVSARIAQDQAAGLTPDFEPLPVARALNRMDAGMLIQAFGSGEKAPKDVVLSAIMRVWLSTLYPFDAAASIEQIGR
ncbi:TetR/AcrR family transcriptional regulator [Meridianimarinicoccus sp. MJW13]|nr:TetR/AcrR family transcriptional regulator [Fluviibacterium sp. MJW13]